MKKVAAIIAVIAAFATLVGSFLTEINEALVIAKDTMLL